MFASNQHDWLFRALFEVSPTTARDIEHSRQFGNEQPDTVGLRATHDQLLSSRNGLEYLSGTAPLGQLDGWKIYYLFDAANISTLLSSGTGRYPFKLIFGLLFLLIGTIVIFLYQRATAEIKRRREIEQDLRDSEEKYRLLFEKSEDPMWVIYDNMFMLANHAAAHSLGYADEHELRSLHPSRISPEFQPDGMSSFDKANEMMQLAYASGYHRFEWQHLRKNGEQFPVEVSLTRIPYGEHDALYCVWRDISETKKSHAALESAMIEAEQANRAKSEFLSAMSHEIRTPMTGVMGFVDLLLDEELPAHSRDKVIRIKSATNALLRLINDILDMSKLEAGKMQIEAIDFALKPLLEEVAGLFERTRKHDATVELKLELGNNLPDFIRSDPTRLRQILINLLGNALKFTHQEEVVLYAQWLDNAGEPQVKFGVRDTGIGISETAMQGLFKEFTQADASISRRYEGSGLGLAISRRLVELLGGQISAESVEAAGSHFWFVVPYQQALSKVENDHSKPSNNEKYQGTRSLNVLIAEDNRVNQMIIRRFMEDFGHKVSIVENGEKVIQAHQSQAFDLILMDVRMPVMDGTQATRHIRALDNANHRIPIIAVTADAMKEHRQEFIECGMDAFVSKPFNRGELARTINVVLGEQIHRRVSAS